MDTQVVIPIANNYKPTMNIDFLVEKIFIKLCGDFEIEELKINMVRTGTPTSIRIIIDHFPNHLFLSRLKNSSSFKLCFKDNLPLTPEHEYYVFPPDINLVHVTNVISSVLLDVYQNTYAHKNEIYGLFIGVMHNSLTIEACYYSNYLSAAGLPDRTQIIKYQHILNLNVNSGESILYLLQKKEGENLYGYP